ncbi:hypothetical protein AB3N02_22540 [Priestia aryabhattai]|uniref:hypothetical protein n=1 Tax=Priestia aryabhattai TaxID=412384 RepID=UPI00399F72E1
MKDFKELHEIDLELELLSGSSLYVGNIEIPSYTLSEIKEYGYSDYMTSLQFISVDIEDFISSVHDMEKRIVLEQEKTNLKSYDFFMSLGGAELRDKTMTAIAMILKTNDLYIIDDSIAVGFMEMGILVENEHGELVVDVDVLDITEQEDLKIVHRGNFDDIVEAVKLQNYLKRPVKKEKSDDDNPADEATRALMEQMKKMKEKVEQKKKKQREQEGNDEDEVNIATIISAISSKSNSINKLNIWNFTIYQLYDEYSRLELIDNYDFSIRAMMAGAEKIELTHWSSKL